MKITNQSMDTNSVPVFATTAAAAGYNVGKEGYIDLLFLRSQFVIDESQEASSVEGNDGIQEQKAELVFSKVAAVTMSAEQAKTLISAIERQLKNLNKA
ncbi:hypothetical protein ABC733_17320 [Mangrovibacter sp. SLW1]